MWKPLVTPLEEPVAIPSGDKLLTKTSLALRHQVIHYIRLIYIIIRCKLIWLNGIKESLKIGAAHNAKAAPFATAKVDERCEILSGFFTGFFTLP